ESVGTMLTKGAHGTTFGGNPLAAAAALATLDTIEAESLMDNVTAVGAHLRSEIGAIDGVREVRGEGLLLGIGLEAPVSARVVAAALEAGFIINAPTPDTIRLAPALNLSTAQADDFIEWLRGYAASHPLASEER
ncbi:MAG: aminotransferase class III-fold pyridoxal phosphate-dependent enzyme, partial [Demequina sp.]